MEFAIGALALIITVVMGLQAIAVHQSREVINDLTRQLKRRENDLAEVKHKLEQARDELRHFPVAYQKPSAINVTFPVARRREDIGQGPKPGIDWDDDDFTFSKG